jgi:membrane protease YdiL (CAAX protease family)
MRIGPGSFLFLTFAASWICWAIVIAAGWHATADPRGAVLYLLGGFGPTVVGWWHLRAAGARDTLPRLVDPRRAGAATWLLALATYPVLFLLASAVHVTLGGAWPTWQGAQTLVQGPAAFAGGLAIVLLLGPVSEEVGWRGYALERFEARRGPLLATLLLGVAWWAWHLPLFFMEGTLHAGEGLLSPFAVGYLVTVLAYTVGFSWLVHRSRRSILIAVAAHVSVNGTLAWATPFDSGVFVAATVLVALLALELIRRDPRLGLPAGDAEPARDETRRRLGATDA